MQKTMTIGEVFGRYRKRDKQTHTDKMQNAWTEIETSLPSVNKDIHGNSGFKLQIWGNF